MVDLETKSSEQITLTKVLQVQKDALAKGDRLKADQIQKQLEEFGIKDIQKAIEQWLKKLTTEQEFVLKQIIEKYPYEKGESILYFAAREKYTKVGEDKFEDRFSEIHPKLDIYASDNNEREIAVLIKDAKIINKSYLTVSWWNPGNRTWVAEYEDVNWNMSCVQLELRGHYVIGLKAFNH